MDFGFIQVAAPASQPVPLADASVPADVSTDAAAAFDAALAATLGPVDGQAAPVAGAGAKLAPPAWLLTQFFAPAVTAFDAATTPVTITAEAAPRDELSVPADVAADDESSDELDALAPNLVVPMPVIAEIKPSTSLGPGNPVAPQGGPVAEGGSGHSAEQTPSAPAPQSRMPAGFDGTAQTRVPAPAVSGGKAGVPANPPAAHAASMPAHAASMAAPAANVPVAAAAVGAAAAEIAAASSAVDSMKAPVQQPATDEALTGIAADRREMPVQVQVQTPHPDAHLGAQPSDAARHVAAAAPAVANAIAAVADQAAPATNAMSAPRYEPADSGATVRQAMSRQAHSGHDAPMTGQDHYGQGQGQGRPSPEFTRLAAALAQVTPAGAEDAGRATGPVVTPVGSSPAPAAAQAPVTAATAAAAPQSAPETPEAESLGRLVQTMRVISRPGAWEANVRLKPEHLGDVNIAVRVERNTVSAVVNAEAAGVRQWLESQEQAVRSGMAEHGLHLERFVVQRDGQRRDNREEPQSRRQPRRQAAPAERFEVVV